MLPDITIVDTPRLSGRVPPVKKPPKAVQQPDADTLLRIRAAMRKPSLSKTDLRFIYRAANQFGFALSHLDEVFDKPRPYVCKQARKFELQDELTITRRPWVPKETFMAWFDERPAEEAPLTQEDYSAFFSEDFVCPAAMEPPPPLVISEASGTALRLTVSGAPVPLSTFTITSQQELDFVVSALRPYLRK